MHQGWHLQQAGYTSVMIPTTSSFSNSNSSSSSILLTKVLRLQLATQAIMLITQRRSLQSLTSCRWTDLTWWMIQCSFTSVRVRITLNTITLIQTSPSQTLSFSSRSKWLEVNPTTVALFIRLQTLADRALPHSPRQTRELWSSTKSWQLLINSVSSRHTSIINRQTELEVERLWP